MTRAPDDERFAEQLFEAARAEAPSDVVKRRALRDVSAPAREARPWRWWLLAAALPLGAGVAWLARPQRPEAGLALTAEPPRASAKAAEAPAPSVSALSSEPLSSSLVPAPAPRASAPVKPRAATLEEELTLVDRARQSLLAGDGERALGELAQYDKLATLRRLGAEATLLRIQALAAQGRGAEAARLARDFVGQNPNNPLVDRAKSFISEPAREK